MPPPPVLRFTCQVVRNGYGNADLRQSYDSVAATMMGLLKGQTIELRDVQEVRLGRYSVGRVRWHRGALLLLLA